MKRVLWAWVVVPSFVAWAWSAAPLRADLFTEIVVFGDSLTDTGNRFASTNNTNPDAGAYYQGRWSNGPVWVERLAVDLGVPTPTASLLGGTNNAWAGAETRLTGNSTVNGTPNIGSQITTYLQSHSTLKSSQLVAVWGGANDFIFGGQSNPSVPVSNLHQEITMLAQHGATSFLVPNLPALGELPNLKSRGSQAEAQFNLLSSQFNSLLATDLAGLATSLGITIYRFDDAALVAQMLSTPAAFGFTDVTDQAKSGGPGSPGTVVPNPDQYLFWDGLHPTRIAHQFIGDGAFAAIAAPVPEPSSLLLLLGIGASTAIGLAWRSRTRKLLKA
jgi:phospholipase/lecithinase/hemolysin